MSEIIPPKDYGERLSEEGFYDRFIAHFIRLGSWDAAEVYMNVTPKSFEIFLADNKEFSVKLHSDILSASCQLAVQSLPKAVASLNTVISNGTEDTKNTLTAITSLTQIISKLQIGDKNKGDEDDIDKLFKKYKGANR